jgi:iron-sulfur cluster insertion protein
MSACGTDHHSVPARDPNELIAGPLTKTDIVVSEGEAPMMPRAINLTAKAAEMVRNAMEQEGLTGHALRVGVMGGGCSGLQYLLDFAKEPTGEDYVVEAEGVRIFIDPFSAGHLQGTVIDYVDGLHGSGFKFENPQVQRSCGCGSSFQT